MTTAAIHKKAETPATTEVSASHTPVIEGNFGLAHPELIDAYSGRLWRLAQDLSFA
jgi:hypothetical protein